MNWKVALDGKNSILETLTSLNAKEFSINKLENSYFLNSMIFNELDSSEKVRNKSKEFLKLINGTIKYKMGVENAVIIFKIIKVINSSPNKKFKTTMLPCHLTIPPKNPEQNEVDIRKIINLSLKNDKVKLICELINDNNMDWVNFYRIYEVIKEDMLREKFESWIDNSSWIGKDEMSCFTQTANSYHAIGSKARHAKSSVKAPEKIMEFSEAQKLIYNLINEWLKLKEQQ